MNNKALAKRLVKQAAVLIKAADGEEFLEQLKPKLKLTRVEEYGAANQPLTDCFLEVKDSKFDVLEDGKAAIRFDPTDEDWELEDGDLEGGGSHWPKQPAFGDEAKQLTDLLTRATSEGNDWALQHIEDLERALVAHNEVKLKAHNG